jgi:hypothetical protein
LRHVFFHPLPPFLPTLTLRNGHDVKLLRRLLLSYGKNLRPLRQDFILLSDVLGVSAVVDALNNPVIGNATASSVQSPFFTDDIRNGLYNLASSPSPSDLSPSLMHRYVHCPARRVDCFRREGEVHICRGLYAAALPRAASPIRVWSSGRGRRTTRVSNI